MFEHFGPVLSKHIINARLGGAFVAIGIENTRDDLNLGKGRPKFEALVPVPDGGSGAGGVTVSIFVFLDHISDN